MSRLTFKIDPDAALVGLKRVSPWVSLRAKLFGIDTDRAGVPVRFSAVHGRNPENVVRRFSATRAAPYLEILASRPEPAKSEPAKMTVAAPLSAIPAPARYQTEYKGRLIVASLMDDGSWTAVHAPLGSDPSALCDLAAQNAHRFLARVMAIASVEIEIDDLEHP